MLRLGRAGRAARDHRSVNMTYIIGEACIDVKDISCQSVCPVDCIHETDRMLVIDAGGVHRLRRLRARVPRRGDPAGGRDPGRLGAVREDQLRLQQAQGIPEVETLVEAVRRRATGITARPRAG